MNPETDHTQSEMNCTVASLQVHFFQPHHHPALRCWPEVLQVDLLSIHPTIYFPYQQSIRNDSLAFLLVMLACRLGAPPSVYSPPNL